VEGWVAGLRLVTLSLRHRGSVDLSLARLQGSVSYVTSYLVGELGGVALCQNRVCY
jgi:ATP/maltotriose-dependent transcriptional regulator MalT